MSFKRDLTNQRFGRLLVTEYAGRHPTNRRHAWRCLCDCGTEKVVVGASLWAGAIASCGCSRRGKCGGSVALDLSGQRFGRLVAVERVEDHLTPKGIRMTQWLFRCDCGTETVKFAGNVRSGTTLSCGCIAVEALVRRSSKVVVNYAGAHRRVYKDKGPASDHACVDCGSTAADWSYDGLDPNELRGGPWNCPYSLSPDHYVARCKGCHGRADADSRKVS